MAGQASGTQAQEWQVPGIRPLWPMPVPGPRGGLDACSRLPQHPLFPELGPNVLFYIHLVTCLPPIRQEL